MPRLTPTAGTGFEPNIPIRLSYRPPAAIEPTWWQKYLVTI